MRDDHSWDSVTYKTDGYMGNGAVREITAPKEGKALKDFVL